MNRNARRLLILGMAAAGALAVRRVLVERSQRAARRQAWMQPDGTSPAPRPLPAPPILTDADALRNADRPAVARREDDAPAATPLEVAEVLAAPPVAEPAAAESPEAEPAEPEPELEGDPQAVGEPEAVSTPDVAAAAVATPDVAAIDDPEPISEPTDADTRPAPEATEAGLGSDGGAEAETPEADGETEADAGPETEAAPLDQVRQRLAALDVDGRGGRSDGGTRPTGTGRTRRPRRTPRWIGPLEDGGCRDTHPVKVKLRSGLFHLPGMLVYDRTRADRCYRSAEDAVADGFEQAKR